MKHLTGNDALVHDYVMSFPQTQEFMKKLDDMVTYLIPFYVKEGKNQLVIAIGCTGGQHRSVTIADELFKALKDKGDYGLKLYHRDVDNRRVKQEAMPVVFFFGSKTRTGGSDPGRTPLPHRGAGGHGSLHPHGTRAETGGRKAAGRRQAPQRKPRGLQKILYFISENNYYQKRHFGVFLKICFGTAAAGLRQRETTGPGCRFLR
jgi:hypothetical protein